MGQAKARGDFEKRKAEAIIRNKEAQERVKEEAKQRFAKLSESKKRQALMLLAMGVGLNAQTEGKP